VVEVQAPFTMTRCCDYDGIPRLRGAQEPGPL